MKKLFELLDSKHDFIYTSVLALVVITTTISQRLNFLVLVEENIVRPYNSVLRLSAVDLLVIGLLFINRFKLRKINLKEPIILYFIYGIVSLVFVFINDSNILLSLVAVVRYIFYILLFILLSDYDLKTFNKGLDIGFKICVSYQMLVGLTFQFFRILLPFAMQPNLESIRSGIIRMYGTFQHPDNLGNYLVIAAIFFISQYLNTKKKNYFIFIFLCFIGIFMTGSRTAMLIMLFSLFLFILVIIKKNNLVTIFKNDRKLLIKTLISFVLVIGVFIYILYKSGILTSLIVEHNIIKMFLTRFYHWIIGYNIMTYNCLNFFFGVGLNNHLDYLIQHFDELKVADYLSNKSFLRKDFVTTNSIHNSYLVCGCELGIVGFLLYILIFVDVFKKAYQQFKNKNYEVIFVLIGIIALGIHNLQSWSGHKDACWVLLIIINVYANLLLNKKIDENC